MEGAASRRFYSIPKSSDFLTCSPESEELEPIISTGDDNHASVVSTSQDKTRQNNDLLSYVASNIIGSEKTFSGPFGLRTAVYLDFVASGRALKFIEDYIRDEVLPEYANTHTTTSITSLQTTLFRHEARDLIRNSCNASEHDSVIFVGSGTTAAIHKLIHSLHLSESPIVFVGPYEHHSNILPWMEAGAEVIRISATSCDQVDIKQLESYLNIFQPFGKTMIGAFSAASNVTGILTDVDAITVCLHKYGALAFWDYAAAAPYVRVDMNPYLGGDNQGFVSKDAVYFSVHKFVGGVGSPGVLIVKKKLLVNPVPDGCGGGTVFYVRRDHHRYLVEPEMKEEGGTPDIVGAIRAGLVFQLRDAIGVDLIKAQDDEILRKASTVWKECPNLILLGPEPLSTERLPIISFLVYHPATGLFLHHNFVTAVLNDVFGIQARGGCACAGPYAMDVLGMTERVSEKMEELLAEDSRLDRIHLRRIGEYSHREIIRPGFVRINLPYFLDPEGLEFVIEALTLISQHAWKLLPQYLFNPETGEWRNKQFQTFKDRKWLGHISYSSGQMSYRQPAQVIKGPLPTNHMDCLEKAREIFHQAERINVKLPDQSLMFDNEARSYRWFLLPSEANACLQNKWKEQPLSPSKLPFCPSSLLERLGHATPTMESESERRKIDMLVTRLKDRAKPKSTFHDSGSQHSKDNGSPVSVPTHDIHCEDLTISNTFEISGKKEELSFSHNVVTALSRGFSLSENCVDVVCNGEKENSEDITSPPANANNSNNNNVIHQQLEREQGQGGSLDSNIPCKGEPKDHCDSNHTEEKKVDPPKASVKGSGDTRMNETNDSVKTEDLRKDNPSCTNSNDDTPAVKDKKKKHAGHWFAPPKVIFKPAVQALEEYKMIQDGDQVLVCLSGGKDSLSLLHTVRQYQFYAKKKGISFKFGAVTVDPQTPSYDPSPLKRYLDILGVPYFYESQCIMETANNLPYECASICSFCSRMKRGRIYAAARREGYNVLALGQHLDDLSESFMMSFLHNGSLNTMKAHYVVKEGDLRVIRPFVYVRETDLRNFAEQNQLPVIAENCPACFEAPKERHRTKQLLAAQEVVFPQVYSSMMTALKPLMARGRQSTPKNEKGVTSTLSSKTDDWDDVDL